LGERLEHGGNERFWRLRASMAGFSVCEHVGVSRKRLVRCGQPGRSQDALLLAPKPVSGLRSSFCLTAQPWVTQVGLSTNIGKVQREKPKTGRAALRSCVFCPSGAARVLVGPQKRRCFYERFAQSPWQ